MEKKKIWIFVDILTSSVVRDNVNVILFIGYRTIKTTQVNQCALHNLQKTKTVRY